MDETVFFERLASYLSQYCFFDGSNPIPPTKSNIISAIHLLIENKIMTKEEMKKEALEDYFVLIPDDYFFKQESE